MRFCAYLFALVLLSGCSTANQYLFPPGEKLAWESIALYVEPVANRDFPLTVDVVMVSEASLAKKIAGMKAGDWFTARDALRKANPTTLDVVSVELAPGDAMSLPQSRFTDRRVFAALAFADYFSAGEHSARLEHLKGKITIEFGATEFSVSTTEK